MNKVILSSFIPLISLIIFFVWGWLEGTYAHSFYVLVAAAVLMLAVMNSGTKKKENAQKEESDGENRS